MALYDSVRLNILWSVACGSEKVTEYWKNEIPTPIFCNIKLRLSGFFDA
jgi:hypothetical protein